MCTAPRYEYTGLGDQDIRLVRLWPGNLEDALRISIVHESLAIHGSKQDLPVSRLSVQRTLPDGWRAYKTPDGRIWYCQPELDEPLTYDHPSLAANSAQPNSALSMDCQFEALSYVWGLSTTGKQVHVLQTDSGDTWSYLPITDNLESALRYLRRVSGPRTLWIDAICINQQDIDERGVQVAHMDRIYRLADRVVVWLGIVSEDSAPEVLCYIGEQVEISEERHMYHSLEAKEWEWYLRGKALPYSHDDWTSLSRLFTLPWFRRIWVVQEIGLANGKAVVQCGNKEVPFRLFRRGTAALSQRNGVPSALNTLIREAGDVLTYGLGTESLRGVLNTARCKDCKDDHDRIYGFLGLLGPKLRSLIQPSYSKDYAQLCKETFVNIVEVTKRLDLLPHASLVEALPAQPSWIPDWRPLKSATWSIAAGSVGYGTQASGASRVSWNINTPGVMELLGRMHGEVLDLAPEFHGSDAVGWLCDTIRTDELDNTYPAGGTVLEAWARLLCMGRLRDRYPKDSLLHDVGQWTLKVRTVLTGVDTDSSHLLLSGPGQVYSQTWRAYRYFHTEHGYVGCGPSWMLPGDIIGTALGLHTALVLRSTPEQTFQVVGGCYVVGLMDNESYLGSLPPQWTVQQHMRENRYQPLYVNTHTGVSTADDPRLEPHADWNRAAMPPDNDLDAPICVDYFEHAMTGEVINYDPRLLPHELQRRGIDLDRIKLV